MRTGQFQQGVPNQMVIILGKLGRIEILKTPKVQQDKAPS